MPVATCRPWVRRYVPAGRGHHWNQLGGCWMACDSRPVAKHTVNDTPRAMPRMAATRSLCAGSASCASLHSSSRRRGGGHRLGDPPSCRSEHHGAAPTWTSSARSRSHTQCWRNVRPRRQAAVRDCAGTTVTMSSHTRSERGSRHPPTCVGPSVGVRCRGGQPVGDGVVVPVRPGEHEAALGLGGHADPGARRASAGQLDGEPAVGGDQPTQLLARRRSRGGAGADREVRRRSPRRRRRRPSRASSAATSVAVAMSSTSVSVGSSSGRRPARAIGLQQACAGVVTAHRHAGEQPGERPSQPDRPEAAVGAPARRRRGRRRAASPARRRSSAALSCGVSIPTSKGSGSDVARTRGRGARRVRRRAARRPRSPAGSHRPGRPSSASTRRMPAMPAITSSVWASAAVASAAACCGEHGGVQRVFTLPATGSLAMTTTVGRTFTRRAPDACRRPCAACRGPCR